MDGKLDLEMKTTLRGTDLERYLTLRSNIDFIRERENKVVLPEYSLWLRIISAGIAALHTASWEKLDAVEEMKGVKIFGKDKNGRDFFDRAAIKAFPLAEISSEDLANELARRSQDIEGTVVPEKRIAGILGMRI